MVTLVGSLSYYFPAILFVGELKDDATCIASLSIKSENDVFILSMF